MDNSARAVFDDKEQDNSPEQHVINPEEVTGPDVRGMVRQESGPCLPCYRQQQACIAALERYNPFINTKFYVFSFRLPILIYLPFPRQRPRIGQTRYNLSCLTFAIWRSVKGVEYAVLGNADHLLSRTPI